MLEINVSQLLKASVGTTLSLEVADMIAIVDGKSMIKGAVMLTRTNRGILARGSLKTEVNTSCCRCLNLFSCPLSITLEEEYFPTTDILSGVRVGGLDEPEGFTISENHVLDLTEAIRQYALMGLSMKPLCHKECAGITDG